MSSQLEKRKKGMGSITICPTCKSPLSTLPWCTTSAPPPALCVFSTNTTAAPELDAPLSAAALLLSLLLLLLLLVVVVVAYRCPWSPICTEGSSTLPQWKCRLSHCRCSLQGRLVSTAAKSDTLHASKHADADRQYRMGLIFECMQRDFSCTWPPDSA